ncbi:hypothetical protein O181_115420 [Austropuccinia psidii MF-1]|uniref:Uncharacterized protein n=1 Tax=Austropuccinia psidii MF-1 TaxID=1389203 RepID=A0A9Q3PWH0_9BASI|nr:hypothetical protein [Austropuccinia psidii MF-1]
MPKASKRLPLLQTLNSPQLINALSSDSDSDIQEDIILLDMITSQRYINSQRRYPSHYMYAINVYTHYHLKGFDSYVGPHMNHLKNWLHKFKVIKPFKTHHKTNNALLPSNWLLHYQGLDQIAFGLLCER